MEQIKNILKAQGIEADDSIITSIGKQRGDFTALFHHQVLADNKAVYLVFGREPDNQTYRAFKYTQNNALIRKADMRSDKIHFSDDKTKKNAVALIVRYVLDDESYDFFEVTQHYNAGKSGSAVFRAIFGTGQCGTSHQRVFKINLVSEIEQEYNNFKKYLYGSRPDSFLVVEYKPEHRADEYAMLTYETVSAFLPHDEVSLLSEHIRRMLSASPTLTMIDNLSIKLKEVFLGDLYALYQKSILSATMTYRQIHDFKLPAIESFDKCLILDESIKEKIKNETIFLKDIKEISSDCFTYSEISDAVNCLMENFREYEVIEIRKQSGRIFLKLLNAEFNRVDIESDDPKFSLTIGNKIAFLSFSEPQKKREAFYGQITQKISSLGIEAFQTYCNPSCIKEAVSQLLDRHEHCYTALAHGDLNPFNILVISDENTGSMKFKIIDYQQLRQDDLFFDLAKLETELLIQYFADNPNFSFAEIKSLAERIFLCDRTLPIPFKFFMNFRNILQFMAEKQGYVMSETGWYRNYLTDIAVYGLAYLKYGYNEERKRQTALVLALENMRIINRFQEYDFKKLRQRISDLLKSERIISGDVPVEIMNQLKKDYELWRNKVADLLMSLAILEKEIHDLELQYHSVFYDYLIKKQKLEFALRKIELMQKKLEFIAQNNVSFIYPEECPLPKGKKKTLNPDHSGSVIINFNQNQYVVKSRDDRTTDFFCGKDFWIGAFSFSNPIRVFSSQSNFFVKDSGEKVFCLKFRPFGKSEILMLILPELKSTIKEYRQNYRKMNAQVETYKRAGAWCSEEIEAFKEIYRKMAKIYSPNAYGMGYPDDWDEKKKEQYKTVWLQMQRCKEAGDLEGLNRIYQLNYDLALGDNEKFIQELLEKGDSQFFSEQIEKLKRDFAEIEKEQDRLRNEEIYGYRKYFSDENEGNALRQKNEAELNKIQHGIEAESRIFKERLEKYKNKIGQSPDY